mmetsp:Transcript_57538/g.103411  ORF Transcript_57538/g.103411 Transcript_57538/m.103411 type:complete len:370 (+) Transcript_57538:356-1465(+)
MKTWPVAASCECQFHKGALSGAVSLVSPQTPCGCTQLSPPQLAIQIVLLDERGIVRLEAAHIWNCISLGVEVKLIEFFDPLHRLSILWSLKLCVCALVVPGVEGVETDHVEPELWDRTAAGLQHLIHVFVVPPGQGEIGNAAAWLIDAVLGAIDWVGVVWVLLETFWEHDGILFRSTAHNKGIPHHGPLLKNAVARHLRQGHDLPQVVEESHEVEPVVLLPWPLLADALSGLEVMDAVREVHIRVRVVNQVVEHLDDLHNGELALVELQPVRLLRPHEVQGLLRVHFIVGLGDLGLSDRGLVIAEGVAEHVLRLQDLVGRALLTVGGGVRVRVTSLALQGEARVLHLRGDLDVDLLRVDLLLCQDRHGI